MKLPFAATRLVQAQLVVKGTCVASCRGSERVMPVWRTCAPRFDMPQMLLLLFAALPVHARSWIWAHAGYSVRLGIRLCALCRLPHCGQWSPH